MVRAREYLMQGKGHEILRKFSAGAVPAAPVTAPIAVIPAMLNEACHHAPLCVAYRLQPFPFVTHVVIPVGRYLCSLQFRLAGGYSGRIRKTGPSGRDAGAQAGEWNDQGDGSGRSRSGAYRH